jgi:hypothetical protein
MPALAFMLLAFGATPARAPGASFAPTVESDESYAETFTVIADLEGGVYVQAQLAISNAGLGSAHGACRLLVATPGKKVWTGALTLDEDDWRFVEKTRTLEMGPCTAQGGERVVLRAQLLRGFVELTFTAPVWPLAPPDIPVLSDDDFYWYEIVAPHSAVTAVVSTPELERTTLTGFAYADHSRGTMLPAKLARGWLRFRGLTGGCPTLLLVRFPPKGGKPEGWSWNPGASDLRRFDELRVELPGVTGSKAGDAHLSAKGLKVHLSPVTHLYRSAPSEEFGLMGRMVSSVVGKVVTHTVRASIERADGCGPQSGILEISHIDD